MFRLVITAVALGSLGLGACTSSSSLRRQAPARDNPRRVDAEELLATEATDLLTALRRARPWFFQTRSQRAIAPVVYLNGVRMRALARLRDLDVRSVRSICLLRASDATTRYGTDHVGGALLVTTHEGSPPTRCPR